MCEFKRAVNPTMHNDHIKAVFCVRNGSLLTNDPGIEITIKYLSTLIKLKSKPDVCKLKYCKKLNTRQLNNVDDKKLILSTDLVKWLKFHSKREIVSDMTIKLSMTMLLIFLRSLFEMNT